MELVYLWVEKYKNIEKQGFNFSPRFECSYDEEKNELTVDENKEYVSIFPENINITAIVGENGSGKSNLLELVFLPHKSYSKNDFQYKVYYYDSIDNVMKFWLSDDSKLSGRINTSLVVEKLHDINLNDINIKIISSLERKYSDHLVYNKIRRTNEYYAGNMSYESMIIIKSIKLFQSNVTIKLREKSIKFNKLEVILKQIELSKSFENAEILSQYNNWINSIQPTNKNFVRPLPDIETLVLINIVTAILNYSQGIEEFHEFYKIFTHKDITFEVLKSYINPEFEDIQTLIQITESFVTEFQKFKIENKRSGNVDVGYKTIFFLEEEKEILDFIKKYNYLFSLYHEEYFEFQMLEIDLISEKDLRLSAYSSGERNLYSKVVELKYEFLFNKKNYFFLMDEPDNFLHPNWTKEFLSIIIQNISTEKKIVNFIISTHSPFLLSDLPKENIIFLEKYKEGDKDVQNGKQKVGNCKNSTTEIDIETFGANIHTLLSHGFFMKDGLMGEFAKEKINEIIDFLKKVEEEKVKKDADFTHLKQEYEKKKKRFWYIQTIIGEEYLRQVIKNHLVEIEKILLGKDKAKQEQIERLQKEIELLQKIPKAEDA